MIQRLFGTSDYSPTEHVVFTQALYPECIFHQCKCFLKSSKLQHHLTQAAFPGFSQMEVHYSGAAQHISLPPQLVLQSLVSASSCPAEPAGRLGLCFVCMDTQCLAHLAALTQRDRSRSPSSVAQPKCCCSQSRAWRPGRWSLGAAHCLGRSVLCGRPSGFEARAPIWI